MIKQIIPTEYYLESPANYDSYFTRSQFASLVDLFGIKKLANGTSTIMSLFKKTEHQEIAHDIFIYLVDTESYDVFDKKNEEQFIKQYTLALFEAGFFG